MMRGDVVTDSVGKEAVSRREAIERAVDIVTDLGSADLDFEAGEQVKRGLGARRVSDREDFQGSGPIFRGKWVGLNS